MKNYWFPMYANKENNYEKNIQVNIICCAVVYVESITVRNF